MLSPASRRRGLLFADLILIFLFTAVLIKPLFKAKYTNRWDSIESAYIADGRFLREHWPHPQWQPLWYCGTRYDYIYPPAVRYGTALLSAIYIPVKAHHVYTALLYCLGIAGVYFLARTMGGSRGWAWLASAGVALVSPVAWLVPKIHLDMPRVTPWSLWVLLRDGEGPHISAVSLLPFALSFSYLALKRKSLRSLASAALFAAGVALTNFYGSTGLGILFPLLVWSLWVTTRDRAVWLWAAAEVLLTFGLTAFWLTPSYLRLTLETLKWFSPPGDRIAQVLFLLSVALFAAISMRVRTNAYRVFLAGSIILLGVNVLGFRWFQIHAIAEPNRLEPEFDLVLVLAAVEVVRELWAWRSKRVVRARLARGLALLLVLVGLGSGRHYLRHAWDGYLYPLEPDYRQRVEYRTSSWIALHMPQARTFATGSIRYWWNTWHDTAQVGGGCDRGLLNPYLNSAGFEVVYGDSPEVSLAWLKAMGVDAIVVPDERSQEAYHDFRLPHKFSGALPVLYDNGRGDVIYEVPRRYRSLARVVDARRLANIHGGWAPTDLEALRRYDAVIEEGPDSPPMTAWQGTDALRIQARVAPGQSVVVQNTYDPAWHAYLGAKELHLHSDPLGFTVIDAPPGDDDIRLVFEMPLENRIGWVLLWLSLVAVAVLVIAEGPRAKRTVQVQSNEVRDLTVQHGDERGATP
jgi:hypothetical protein